MKDFLEVSGHREREVSGEVEGNVNQVREGVEDLSGEVKLDEMKS